MIYKLNDGFFTLDQGFNDCYGHSTPSWMRLTELFIKLSINDKFNGYYKLSWLYQYCNMIPKFYDTNYVNKPNIFHRMGMKSSDFK